MKKYIILLLLFVTATAVQAQDVTTKVIRITDAATSLAQAIPVGTHLYDIANQQTYVATAGVAAGQSLTTAAASFKLISGTTAVIDNVTSTSTTDALSANQGKVLEDNKLNKALADASLFVGNGSNEAAAVALSGDATLANDGTLTIADDAVDGSDISLTDEAAGDMAYYNGTEWVRLPKGAANQSLVMDATATAPQWQSGGATEDVEVVLDEQVIGDGGTLSLPADLSDYAYLRFEVDDLQSGGYVHSFSEIVEVDIAANKLVYLYSQSTYYARFVINATATTATLQESFAGTSATARVIGIKPQKVVLDPSLTTVIDDDSFATATDANVPSAESVMAYVDEKLKALSAKRIGEFVYAKTGKTLANGYLEVKPGTVANGAIDYPLWAAQYPEYVSGNDIVFPANVAGMFLRNLGGNAGAEGAYQGYRTARPTASAFQTNVAGNHSHPIASSSGDTGETNGSYAMMDNTEYIGTRQTNSAGSHSHSITAGGDVETNPINRAYRLYTIVDTY